MIELGYVQAPHPDPERRDNFIPKTIQALTQATSDAYDDGATEATIVANDVLKKAVKDAKREERERLWSEVSFHKPTLLANYPRGKKDNYNSGRIDGWNLCKEFVKKALTLKVTGTTPE